MTTTQNSPGIVDIATYLPSRVIGNEELIERFEFDPAFLENKIGISERRIAAPEESVSDMAVEAAQTLLARHPEEKEKIGLLLLCTQNPDYRLPTTANLVQDRLGLPTNIQAVDINQGCSGYIYGLSIASALIQAHQLSSALLITADAYSKVMDPNDRNTVPLFSDGAAATLITSDGTASIGAFSFGSDGSGAEDLIVRAGGSRHPEKLVTGDDALHMDGRAVFEFMLNRVPRDVDNCLEQNNTSRSDIDLFVFHQASRFMLETLTRRMHLDPDQVPICMEKFGNTVSSTIPMTIEQLGGIQNLRNKTLLLSGFGVGLSWGSTILRIS
jgi:3-oxoacyl-[acyl-carrier-protein] synthase III